MYIDLTYRTFVYFVQIIMPPDEQSLRLPSHDRFNNLNIYLIDYILCRLSFRDVVRVSTLLKDMKYFLLENTRGHDILYRWIYSDS